MPIFALDLHRRTTTAVRLEDDGTLSFQDTQPTCKATFAAWIQAQTPGTKWIVEPTGAAYTVLDMARAGGLQPVLTSTWALGPLAMRRVKDDQQDALRLAQLEHGQVLHQVWIPDPATRELRQLVAHREHLVELRTSLKNRVRALYQRNLVEMPAQPFETQLGLDALRGLRRQLPVVDQLLTDQDLTLVRLLAQQITQVEDQVAARVQARWETPLLLSIPCLSLSTLLDPGKSTLGSMNLLGIGTRRSCRPLALGVT